MATTETMSIHRALSEVKMIETRLNHLIPNLVSCAIINPDTTTIRGKSIERFKTDTKADLDRVIDLITRRNAIKAAVAQSNAVTKVKLNSMPGVDLTIAQAIDLKNNAMTFIRNLNNQLSNQYTHMRAAMDDKMSTRERECDNYIRQVFGGNTNAQITPETAEAIKIARENWMKANMPTAVDPCDLERLTKTYDEKIAAFDAEIDAVLSESNAITMITFSYENHSEAGLGIG